MIRKVFLILWIKILSFFRKDTTGMKIKLYRIKGYNIGNNCRIFTQLNVAEPYLITIGDNVTISTNVTFLTHDNSIIKASKNEYTDLFGKIIIGNNCFIGANAIILPGVCLPNNTIVAAGSVVTKSIKEPNMIIAGNPSKIVGNIDDYYKKNKNYAFNCNDLNKEERKKMIINNSERLISKKYISSK